MHCFSPQYANSLFIDKFSSFIWSGFISRSSLIMYYPMSIFNRKRMSIYEAASTSDLDI